MAKQQQNQPAKPGQQNPQAQQGQQPEGRNPQRQGNEQQQHQGNQDAQRHQKQHQAGQMSADKEQSPKMDRGDSEGGSGESIRRGALNTQYDADGDKAQQKESSQGGSGQSKPHAANPGSSEKSTGSERDTMSGSRDSGRS